MQIAVGQVRDFVKDVKEEALATYYRSLLMFVINTVSP